MVSGVAEWNAEEASEFCRLFCGLFEALSREAEEAGKKTWKMKPKLHLMQESCLQIVRVLANLYLGESASDAPSIAAPPIPGRVCVRPSLHRGPTFCHCFLVFLLKPT